MAKDETILKLRREIADLRTAAAGDGLDGSATLEEENRALRAERDSLRRQVRYESVAATHLQVEWRC